MRTFRNPLGRSLPGVPVVSPAANRAICRCPWGLVPKETARTRGTHSCKNASNDPRWLKGIPSRLTQRVDENPHRPDSASMTRAGNRSSSEMASASGELNSQPACRDSVNAPKPLEPAFTQPVPAEIRDPQVFVVPDHHIGHIPFPVQQQGHLSVNLVGN